MCVCLDYKYHKRVMKSNRAHLLCTHTHTHTHTHTECNINPCPRKDRLCNLVYICAAQCLHADRLALRLLSPHSMLVDNTTHPIWWWVSSSVKSTNNTKDLPASPAEKLETGGDNLSLSRISLPSGESTVVP